MDITENFPSQGRPTAPEDAASKFHPPIDFTKRIPELDGLRGLAIGTVVFVHYVWFTFMAHPSPVLGTIFASTRPLWSAVDLFFVLSGFLIGGNLLDARDSTNYFSTFYIRRFCRVLPVYFLFLIATAAAYRFVYRPIGSPMDGFFAGRLPWYAYLTFGQNFWMAKLNDVGPPILAITWAFAVEVQFYMIVPSIIRFARRSALPYIFTAGVALAPIIRLFFAYHFRNNLWATYVLLPSRMDSLFLGLLCAYFVREPAFWKWLSKERATLWMACLALFAGTSVLNTNGIPFTLLWITVGYGWTSLFYSTVLLLSVTKSSETISIVLRSRWLTSLGTISYGIYLFHAGVYGLCVWLLARRGYQRTGWQDFAATLLVLAITFNLGKLSWQYFERPIVRWSHALQYGQLSASKSRVSDTNPINAQLDVSSGATRFYLTYDTCQPMLFPVHSVQQEAKIQPSEVGFVARQ
jgi:peptidoglycan/LPS O-acetylase OafA/YrhL